MEPGQQFRQPMVEDRAQRAYGSGNLDSLFPDGAPRTSIPLSTYNMSRSYDKEAVHKTLSSPPTEDQFVDVDPRHIKVSQGQVTRSGVKHYLPGGDYEKTGTTFADKHNVGNRHPVLYDRQDGSERVLLSGHHRAMAAMISGQPLRVRRVQGP